MMKKRKNESDYDVYYKVRGQNRAQKTRFYTKQGATNFKKQLENMNGVCNIKIKEWKY